MSTGFHPFGGRISKRFGESQLRAHDDAILSYHDIRITHEDVETLKDDWLTDNIIAFWEEFLEHDVLDKYKNAHIVLLKPTMAMMLRAGEYSNLPDFSKTTHIFIPVNNANTNASAESGSHWSLLLVSVVDGTAFHYDSSEEMNLEPAEDCAANLGKHLRRRLRVISLGDSPQQRNSSDCGVYVCMAMRHLLTRRLLKKNSSEKVSMSLGGRDIDARAGRKEMLAIIKECRKEGEKRRSISVSPHVNGNNDPPRIGPENEDPPAQQDQS